MKILLPTTVGAPSMWIRLPGITNCHSGLLVVALTQCKTPPESVCSPSPKTSKSPTTAGELTDASLRYGALFVHVAAGGFFALKGNRCAEGRLNAPIPAT